MAEVKSKLEYVAASYECGTEIEEDLSQAKSEHSFVSGLVLIIMRVYILENVMGV